MDNQPSKNQEQEVDLVPVFVWISNGFKNLFKAIGSFFIGIAHFFVLTLIFIKSHVIMLGIFFLVGGALGNYFSRESKKIFTAQLRVQPNFQSAAQLISNLEYYSSLVYQEDFLALANELGITAPEAEQLKSFEIKPDFNDTELLKEYDGFARSSDTMALENFTFEGFKAAKRDIDYEYYTVQISGTNKKALGKAATYAVQVEDNPVIKGLRLSSIETNTFNIKSLEYQLTEIDSLVYAFQTAIKSTDSQSQASTNVYMGDQRNTNTFSDLFNHKATTLYRLKEAREDKYSFDNIVNISSYFVKQGTIEKQYLTMKGAFIFLGIGLLFALVPAVLRFLRSYKV
jgi:hypothetical protein